MAEERSGPLETGADMDYAEHDKAYNIFIGITKWGTMVTVALLIAMAFGFFVSAAGFFSSTILFILLCIGGYFLLR